MSKVDNGDVVETVSFKVFWIVIGSAASVAIAVSSVVLALPLLVTTAMAGGCAAAFVAGLRLVVHGGGPMFARVKHDARVTLVRWSTLGAAAYAAWAIGAAYRPDLWMAWVLGLTGLGWLAHAVAQAHEYLLTLPRHSVPLMAANARPMAVAAPAPVSAEDQPTLIIKETLRRARMDYLNVLSWQSVGAPVAYGVRYRVRTPGRRLPAEGSKDTDKRDRSALSLADAEPIAIALQDVLGIELESEWVAISKERGAGTYTLTVVTQDVMAAVYPYPNRPQWHSITDPALVGYSLSGEAYYLLLKAHGMIVGTSTWGKSSLLHAIIAHLTLCGDALLWVCGTQKLYDLVAGWIECYAGTDRDLPLNWIANGQADTLRTLAAAMAIARWRQSRPMHKRGGWPTIVIIFDEASFGLDNRTDRIMFQGVERTASELVNEIAKGAASADVFIILASQRSTQSNLGDEGTNIAANMSWSAVFKSQDQAEVGRMMGLGHYKLPVPRHRGEMWLAAGDGNLPQNLKAPYLQSVDPTKPKLHDGATIAEVAWSRRDYVTPLDAGSARAADIATGGAYSARHTRMDAAMAAYLTGETHHDDEAENDQLGYGAGEHRAVEHLAAGDLVTAGAMSGPGRAGYELAAAELDRLLTQTGAEPGVPAPRPTPAPAAAGPARAAGAVLTLAERRPRGERVVAIVREAGRALTRAEVLDLLRASGDEADGQLVMNALSKAVADGLLTRPGRGLYQAPDTGSTAGTGAEAAGGGAW